MGNYEEQAKENLIKEILEITRDNLEELNAEELEIVNKTLHNEKGLCNCGKQFENEQNEEIGFCSDCR